LSKLLIRSFSILPNRKRVLLKLLNGYFIETKEEKIDKVSTKIHKKKLKTCLCSFFELFTKIKENRIEIGNLVYNILDNYLKDDNMDIKSVCIFMKYLTQDTGYHQHIIIGEILKRMKKELKNQNIFEKWLNILIEFDLNEYVVESKQKEESIEILKKLTKQLIEIMVR